MSPGRNLSYERLPLWHRSNVRIETRFAHLRLSHIEHLRKRGLTCSRDLPAVLANKWHRDECDLNVRRGNAKRVFCSTDFSLCGFDFGLAPVKKREEQFKTTQAEACATELR